MLSRSDEGPYLRGPENCISRLILRTTRIAGLIAPKYSLLNEYHRPFKY